MFKSLSPEQEQMVQDLYSTGEFSIRTLRKYINQEWDIQISVSGLFYYLHPEKRNEEKDMSKCQTDWDLFLLIADEIETRKDLDSCSLHVYNKVKKMKLTNENKHQIADLLGIPLDVVILFWTL